MAAFHAAQAFLLPKLGRAAKTHRGVSAEFSRLSKDDPRLDIELRKFLGRGYNVKEQADYGLQAPTTTQAQAGEMPATARRFVDVVEQMVSRSS